jgi:hypothetical protein
MKPLGKPSRTKSITDSLSSIASMSTEHFISEAGASEVLYPSPCTKEKVTLGSRASLLRVELPDKDRFPLTARPALAILAPVVLVAPCDELRRIPIVTTVNPIKVAMATCVAMEAVAMVAAACATKPLLAVLEVAVDAADTPVAEELPAV